MDAVLESQVREHIITFPERQKDSEEMRDEWKDFKQKALLIMIGFLGSLLAIGVWVGTVQTSITNIASVSSRTSTQYDTIEKRVNSLEVTNGEIRSRLSSIDATLLEIKVAIKELR